VKVLRAASLTLLVVLLIIPSSPGQEPGSPKPKTKPEPEPTPPPGEQQVPVAKPATDYMSTFLSRSTRPLGLKKDVLARKLLQQRPTKWVERSGVRHIFN
jgi:hypothetical protein